MFINEVSPTAQTVVYGQRSGSCAAMMLYAAGHYQLVLPKSGQTVPPWVHLLKDSEDMEHFPRGGGERFQCGSGPRSLPSQVSDGWAPSRYASSVASSAVRASSQNGKRGASDKEVVSAPSPARTLPLLAARKLQFAARRLQRLQARFWPLRLQGSQSQGFLVDLGRG